MSTPNIGYRPMADAQSDAIHVAVMPVVADQDMEPGDPVNILAYTNRVKTSIKGDSIGIVDPFRHGYIPKDSACWLLLNPGSITSLRHEWTHPKIHQTETSPSRDPEGKHLRYLEDVARDAGVTLERLKMHAEDWVEGGNYWRGGEDFEGLYVDTEFWRSFNAVYGTEYPEDTGNFFTCAC